MEENVKIVLLGHQKIISKESIQNRQPLITEDNFKSIRLPPSMGTFKPKMKVLHSCLYYTIAVEKQLPQSQSFTFREKCLSQISDYYIQQKMNFQLYQYAFLCSRILSVPLDKVMHVVYFLVYARLASKPFIKNIIMEMEMKNRTFKKKPTMRSQKDYSVQSRSQDSRHFTVFCDGNGTQNENLRRELKRIMNPQAVQSKKMTKKLQNRRYFNIKKLYPNESEFKDEIQPQKVGQYHSAATSRIATIPNKVCNRENSSVITRLKFNSGISSQDSLFKKVHVRRQKFNEKFESSQKYLKLLSSKHSKQNIKPENIQPKVAAQKDPKGNFAPYYRSQKNAFEYFQGIATNIKSKNEQFDVVRYSCMNHKQRNLFSYKQSRPFCNFDRDSFLSKNTLKTENEQMESTQTYTKMETNRQTTKKSIKKQEYTSAQTQKQKDVCKMTKTASEGKFPFAQMILQDYILGSITRKNESVAVDDDQIVLFTRKLKNKFKLQKYKQEYQQFLKTQLFQKSKEVC